MAVGLWVALFVAVSAVCAWLVLGSGADTVAGLAAPYLLGADIVRWSENGIRVFVGGTWVLLAVWFVLGLFEPALRL